MSELNIQTFRASTMIVASFCPYLAISGRDHETARSSSLGRWVKGGK
jgi:hypothetical protein